MKILILTGNTGEGHNQTSKALIEEFNALGHQCTAVDSLSFLSKKKSEFLCGWHLRLYRYLPWISSVGYSLIDRDPSPLETPKKWMFEFFARGADQLNQLIISEGYDTVISVHPFSAIIIAGLQIKYAETKVITAFVPTDYTCSPGAASGNIDIYFVPHKDLTDLFIKRGIPKEKIIPTNGIPVNKAFLVAPTKGEAKKLIGLKENEKSVLLTCGSMGCGPIYKLTKKLSRKMSDNVKLFVVCGTNKKLYNKLLKKQLPKNVTVIGFTDKMLYYMASSDVFITKPGGISSTEAAALGVPTIFVNTVGGCETYNCNFFVGKGSAKTSKNLNTLVEMTLKTLDGDFEFIEASNKMKEEFSESASKTITAYLSNLKK